MLVKKPKPISKKSLITARDIDTILTWATIVSKEKVWTKSDAKLALKLKMEQKRLRQIVRAEYCAKLSLVKFINPKKGVFKLNI